MIVYYILICVIGVTVFFSPIVISSYRDYSNLEAGDRIWIRFKVDSKNPTNYYPSIVERAPDNSSTLAYSDGLDYHIIKFSDFLLLRIMTEERYDALTD